MSEIRTSRDQITTIRLNLQAIEAQIESKVITPKSLEDLKSAVDDVRLRIWAIMSAQHMPNGAGALKRFRVRRAVELLDSVTTDLKDPEVMIGEKEIGLLQAAAQRFSHQAELIKVRLA